MNNTEEIKKRIEKIEVQIEKLEHKEIKGVKAEKMKRTLTELKETLVIVLQYLETENIK